MIVNVQICKSPSSTSGLYNSNMINGWFVKTWRGGGPPRTPLSPLNCGISPVALLGRPLWQASLVRATVTPQLPNRNPICWLPASWWMVQKTGGDDNQTEGFLLRFVFSFMAIKIRKWKKTKSVCNHDTKHTSFKHPLSSLAFPFQHAGASCIHGAYTCTWICCVCQVPCTCRDVPKWTLSEIVHEYMHIFDLLWERADLHANFLSTDCLVFWS